MTYQATLDWMYQRLPMYQQRGASAYTGKLDHILELSHYLENPHTKFKSIHVAGTNGKGSSSHMLASVLQEAGYRVGLYTSPHLKDFRERIKINGEEISKTFVKEFVKEHRSFLERGSYSFFELSVAMAFQFFAKREVDIAIIEVGLGGRLDSTNIIRPVVSLITNIGMDHMELLGDTLEKITLEKAGIIKQSVPVVISEYQEETAALFKEVAKKQESEIYFAEKDVRETYRTDLKGSYQNHNVKGVVGCLRALKGFEVTDEHIREGLNAVIANTGIQGRYQVLQETPLVICDTAHNREGFKEVLGQLAKENRKTIHIVLGFVIEKNLDHVLPLFPKKAHYYFVRPDVRRGLAAEKLREAARKYGLKGSAYGSVKEGYETALRAASSNDLIYVGGSTFTVAEVI
ncbi:MAG: bifunctional folylpolyglutamate synthase/dihydrofolate synthase [Bacteroidia bacterium]|nr:bifunctional folylpolyglutamate synthase/dihydrofolate synthase [Bacteroidia bacterium]